MSRKEEPQDRQAWAEKRVSPNDSPGFMVYSPFGERISLEPENSSQRRKGPGLKLYSTVFMQTVCISLVIFILAFDGAEAFSFELSPELSLDN